MAEFDLDFRDAEQKRYDEWKKWQFCVTCFTRKHPDQFEPDGNSCKDCRDE